MKIALLIPSSSFEKNSYGKLQKFSNPQPSIGLAYMGAILEENGYQVKIVDSYVNNYAINDILRQIEDCDVLGISLVTTSANATYKLVKEVRRHFPKIIIIYGNLHPSLFPEEIFTNDYGDYIVHREGEISFLELCNYLSGQSKLEKSEIHGISYPENGEIKTNHPRPFIEDLDSLPFPAWHYYDLNKYSTDPRTQVIPHAKELQILGTRGCPNQCTFCSNRSERSLGQKYRMRSPKNILEEIEYFHRRYDVTIFNFMDLAFPLVKTHAIEFCRLMIESGMNKKVKWVTELRVNPLDKEMVSLMNKAGCARVCFGIESGNIEILKRIKKGFTLDDVIRAVNLCKEEGIEVDGMFILGFPGETKETMEETVQFAIALDVRFAIFNLFVPYPGCALYDELRAQDKIHFKDWSDFVSYPTYGDRSPVYVPDGLTKFELMEIQSTAMRQFYLRPHFVWRQIKDFRLSFLQHYLVGLKGILFPKS